MAASPIWPALRSLYLRALTLLLVCLGAPMLVACNPVLNSPHPLGSERENTLFFPTLYHSPKFLDPASSYSNDETPFTYQAYEPLYAYHYLKRPYELIGRTAQEVAAPLYLDKDGKPLPDNAPPQQIAESVYDIHIKPGILFAPHPAFAKDAQGRYVYHALAAKDLEGKHVLPDFPQTGTRELTADDYVYAIRRLATPRVISPSYSTLAEYIVGFKDYGARIAQADKALRRELPPTQRDLPHLDFRQHPFEGVSAPDKYTLRIRVLGKYPQFKYWLAMTFFAPIPWEAEAFYAQPGMAERNLSLNFWPAGTGPYMLTEYATNRRHTMLRNPHYRGEPYPCEGAPGDKEKGLLDDCGKPTPFVDKLVFEIEKESVPLHAKFKQGFYDSPAVERLDMGTQYLTAMVDDPNKEKEYRDKGFRLPTTVEPNNWYLAFNWMDPVVGQGKTPDQADRNRKLRQALSIALDWEEYVSIFWDMQGVAAHGPLPPSLFGYREDGPSAFNPVVYRKQADGKVVRRSIEEAQDLLAQAGYPGGRDAKTGQPLVLNFDYQLVPTGKAKAELDWYARQFAKLGIQMEVRATDFNRFRDKLKTGGVQIFFAGWLADYPDAENFFFLLYGPNSTAMTGGNGENNANYQNPQFDAAFERMKLLDDGPEKQAVIDKMIEITQRDAVWSFGYFPTSAAAFHQWVFNGKPTQITRNHISYLRLDAPLRAAKMAAWNVPVWWPLPLMLLLVAGLVAPAFWLWRRRDRETAARTLASVE